VGQRDLPLASGTEHVTAFERAGWVVARRAKNAHVILKKPGVPFALSIPDHDQVKRALLQKQIRNAGLTEEEYCDYFFGRR